MTLKSFRIEAMLLALAVLAPAQTFDVASAKRSEKYAGKDYRGKVVFGPGRVTARNVSLKTLIADAYHVQLFQVTGGPKWLDEEEYDVDARAASGSTPDQLREMMQAMLAERFHLALHRDKKQLKAYALKVDKGGIKIAPIAGDSQTRSGYRGTMSDLANLISIQLTIPQANANPSIPSIASGPPVAVIDKTGLDGTYDLTPTVHFEAGTDKFTYWQHVLKDDLGLRLDAEKDPVEVLVIDRADRMPTAN